MVKDMKTECWWCGKPATHSSFDPYWMVEAKACRKHVKEMRESTRQSQRAVDHMEGYVR